MTQFKQLQTGEVLSEQQFYKVEKIVGDKVQLKPDQGQSIIVDAKYVDEHLISAKQYSSEKSVTKTEAATLFLGSGGTAMTVNFNKQVKDSDVVDEIMNSINKKMSDTALKSAIKSAVKRALEGEERTMVGRHYGQVNELGRVSFIDMEADKGTGGFDSRLRQVDPRTINYLIIKGVKYKVK